MGGLAADRRGCSETAAVLELDVHHDHIGTELSCRRDGVGDRGGFADDLDLRARLRKKAHAVANEGMIVDDEQGDRHLASTGMTARTR